MQTDPIYIFIFLLPLFPREQGVWASLAGRCRCGLAEHQQIKLNMDEVGGGACLGHALTLCALYMGICIMRF